MTQPLPPRNPHLLAWTSIWTLAAIGWTALSTMFVLSSDTLMRWLLFSGHAKYLLGVAMVLMLLWPTLRQQLGERLVRAYLLTAASLFGVFGALLVFALKEQGFLAVVGLTTLSFLAMALFASSTLLHATVDESHDFAMEAATPFVEQGFIVREDYQFKCLVNSIMPELVQRKKAGAPLRVWVLPSSSGASGTARPCRTSSRPSRPRTPPSALPLRGRSGALAIAPSCRGSSAPISITRARVAVELAMAWFLCSVNCRIWASKKRILEAGASASLATCVT